MNSAVMICCSAIQAEAVRLWQTYWPDHELKSFTSTMHLHPERLAATLHKVLAAELTQGRRAVLIYGDCCARMTALETMPGVVRTRGKNCCELLLGPGEYRRLSHEGAFFIIPKWARRWKRFFSGLGLSRDNAACMMQELHRTLIYLDTGLVPVPEHALKECAAYCGLPIEILPVSLERLRLAMEEALLRNDTSGEAQ